MSKEQTRKIFLPLVKGSNGKFQAVLSDTSIDRDDEFMGEKLIDSWVKNVGQIPALVDHENKFLNQVATWKNPRKEKINGHSALLMDPHWLNSNPKTKIIRGMLEEGAKGGISIGAIATDFEMVKIKGKPYRKWVKAELLEASFVAIQSNRNAHISIAKTYDVANNFVKGDKSMKAKDQKKYEEDGKHVHTDEDPMGEHNHPEIEQVIARLREQMFELQDSMASTIKSVNNTGETMKQEEELEKLNETIEAQNKEIETLKKQLEDKPADPPADDAEDDKEDKEEKSIDVDVMTKTITDNVLKALEPKLSKTVNDMMIKLPETPGTEEEIEDKKDKDMSGDEMIQKLKGGKQE